MGNGSQLHYWDGERWTEQTRSPDQRSDGGEPVRKSHRIFMWVFLAIQVLFLVWVISAIIASGGSATDCGSLDQATCDTAKNVGAGIGVALIIGIWFFVDLFLGVAYGVYRLAKHRD